MSVSDESNSYINSVSKELFEYLPPLTKRPDFDAFWEETLGQASRKPLNALLKPYDYPSDYVKVYDIEYNGFDDTRIHGWYILPAFRETKNLPCLIHYHGFGGDRGKPANFMHWINMGIAVVSIDCRDQCGETGNCAHYSSGSTQSVVCRGVLDKAEYYFRAVYVDCIKAIDFAVAQPEINPDRILLHGGSQGGALTMAVCALDSRPYLAMADVPSNSNLEKRIENSHGAFASVTDYLKKYPFRTQQVFETLSYFDTMNMSDKIKCRILASVGLKDQICPARLYFASYNRITAPKEIVLYPFNGHEGGGSTHEEIKLRFLQRNL